MRRRIPYLILIAVFTSLQSWSQPVVATDYAGVTTGDTFSMPDITSTSKFSPAMGLPVYRTNNTTDYYGLSADNDPGSSYHLFSSKDTGAGSAVRNNPETYFEVYGVCSPHWHSVCIVAATYTRGTGLPGTTITNTDKKITQ